MTGDRPLLLDGAMGTELWRAGLPRDVLPERWLAEQPEQVKAIHAAYRAAGCEAVFTNTFGATRVPLARAGLPGTAESLNRGAVALARKAAPGARVFGSMGPIWVPEGDPPVEPAEAFEAWTEQAGALLAAGADAIVVESFTDPAAAALAVSAAKDAGAPLVLAMFAAHHEEGARQAVAAGADAVGVNCGDDPRAAPSLVERLRAAVPAAVPVAAKPSAGLPVNGPHGPVWPCDPPLFAAVIAACVAAGASMVGGCCGTTPAHLAAVRKRG